MASETGMAWEAVEGAQAQMLLRLLHRPWQVSNGALLMLVTQCQGQQIPSICVSSQKGSLLPTAGLSLPSSSAFSPCPLSQVLLLSFISIMVLISHIQYTGWH